MIATFESRLLRAVLVFGAIATGNSSVAHAQSCAGAERWAAACGEARALDVEVVFCPTGGLVLHARVGDGEPVRVEIARGRRDAFRTVEGLGVSPVGQYEDWNAAPESVREGFDRVLACVEDDPSLDISEGTLVPHEESPPEQAEPVLPSGPWLALLGALVALAVFGRRAFVRPRLARDWPKRAGRARHIDRRKLWTGVALLLLGIATFVGRALLVPFAYAHQNGQGPLWIDHALGAPSTYGPGYAELFGHIARNAADPDRAIFLTQALLAAPAPILLWLIARRSGVRPPLAWAFAIALAIEPGFARLSGSESYFATIGSLLLLAGAALATGAFRARVRDVDFALGVAAAGLLAAAAVRIHPIAAVPAACLPLVAFVGPGSLRARLRVASIATLGVGALAIAGFVTAFGDMTGGELGSTWLPGIASHIEHSRVGRAFVLSMVFGFLIVVLARRTRRALFRALALAVVFIVAATSHVLGDVPPIIDFGYQSLFAAPAAAALAAGLSDVVLPSVAARMKLAVPVLVLLIAAVGVALRAPSLTALPTDARELDALLAWRAELPRDTTVAFLGVSGRRRLFLPMHGAWSASSPYALQLDSEHPAPNLTSLDARVVYYYRSSLCAAPEARIWCETLERTYRLSAVQEATLPAIPSMSGLGYGQEAVDVALFRVEGL